MNTSILSQELEPLNAQIGRVREKVETLEGDLRLAEAELETFSAERQRFDALQAVCNALETLDELGAGELFWDGMQQAGDAAGHRSRARERISRFEEQIRDIVERRGDLRAKLDLQLGELEYLYEEVRQAYAREERRREEFVIEREVSPVPCLATVMPWSGWSESEKRFRKAILISLFWSVALGTVIPLVNLPIPDRSAVVVEIPERLATLVKKEPPLPEPVPERIKEKKPEPEEAEKTAKAEKPDKARKTSEKQVKVAKEEAKPAGGGGGAQAARKKAENTGVLAFKSSFADLMDETPVARLGAEAHLNKKDMQAPGQARASRSLVAMQAKGGGSGGIGNVGVSRNLGGGGNGGGSGYGNAGQIGGVGFARVESAVEGLAAEAGRPLSDGPGPGRTDEEIQIVFDRYKATLYRIYNKELRKDPTLRGKLLLRIAIEPDGSVSLCKVESSDLASDELMALIVARVEKFNFGPKEDVPKTTILYPIDFLPAG